MRSFDAETGGFITRTYKRGKYQDQYAEIINNAKELIIGAQPNLERDCKDRLPEEVLERLKKQLL